MAPSKKKAAPAPASKVTAKTHDGRPTRKEKSAANKVLHRVTVQSGQRLAKETAESVLELGKKAVKNMQAATPPHKIITEQKSGRPWLYERMEWSDELGEQLFVLFSTGHTMHGVARMDGMPSLAQQMMWNAQKEHPFSECRTRARENAIALYEDAVKEIAVTANEYTIVTRKQHVTKDGDVIDIEEERVVDNVERSKLAIQGLTWTLGHLSPKKHGKQTSNGEDTGNAQLESLFSALKSGPAQ